MTFSPQPIVVGLGELLWDDFPDGKRPGGAPANVAFQSQQLGGRGVVASRVGTDADGKELVRFLESKGLDVSAIQQDGSHPTGRVSVSFGANGEPAYQIHENAAWDFLELTDQLCMTMQQASSVCFGTLAQRNPTARSVISEALALTQPGCLRVYDVNLRQSYYDKDWIERSLQLASLVKLNDEEVRTLAPLLELPEAELPFAQELLRRGGPEVVCITRGARGCLAVSAMEVHDVPGVAVKVADTVGAGDAFTAGLIFARLSGWGLGRSAEFANRVGGLAASRQGAMPELRVEFLRLVAQYEP